MNVHLAKRREVLGLLIEDVATILREVFEELPCVNKTMDHLLLDRKRSRKSGIEDGS